MMYKHVGHARLDSENQIGDQREGLDDESYKTRGENTPSPRLFSFVI